jgi:hypothetical protein
MIAISPEQIFAASIPAEVNYKAAEKATWDLANIWFSK